MRPGMVTPLLSLLSALYVFGPGLSFSLLRVRVKNFVQAKISSSSHLISAFCRSLYVNVQAIVQINGHYIDQCI